MQATPHTTTTPTRAPVARYASVGTVSSGTMRDDDLIDAFTSELEYQLKRQSRRFKRGAMRKLLRECYHWQAQHDTDQAEDGSDLVTELFDALETFAPPYGYFGAVDGDGADYGFWISDPRECGFDGLVLDAGDSAPRAYRGEVLTISDHGNMTLYCVDARGKWHEIWGVV
jgi:hypothetical protein